MLELWRKPSVEDLSSTKKYRYKFIQLQEATIINNVDKKIPQIHIALENRQANQQVVVIQMEGMVTNQLVSILIDLGSNFSYVNPNIVEKCKLPKKAHRESWLAQLATGTKIQVTNIIKLCSLDIG